MWWMESGSMSVTAWRRCPANSLNFNFESLEELAASCRLFQNESKQSHQTYFLADIPNTNTLGLRNFSLYLEIEFSPSYRLTRMEILFLTRWRWPQKVAWHEDPREDLESGRERTHKSFKTCVIVDLSMPLELSSSFLSTHHTLRHIHSLSDEISKVFSYVLYISSKVRSLHVQLLSRNGSFEQISMPSDKSEWFQDIPSALSCIDIMENTISSVGWMREIVVILFFLHQ